MKMITCEELRTMLLTRTTPAMVSMVFATLPDMTMKGRDDKLPNPFIIGDSKATAVSLVCKANKYNGTIAGRYENMVTNKHTKNIQAERAAANLPPATEAEIEAIVAERFRQGTSWHRPILDAENAPTCLSVNKKDGDDAGAYLRFVYKAAGDAEFMMIANAEPVAEARLTQYLPKPSNYANQGLDGDEVRFICPKLESIIEIAIDGERYRITDNFTAWPIETRTRLWNMADEYVAGEKKMAQV